MNPIRIRIKSFQSIDDLEFEVRGFTALTGRSNIGKSSIMRALSRALLNSPVTGMVRKGSKYVVVEMDGGDWSFKWEKGEREVNRYTINGKVYDKTGQNQLPEIERMGFSSIRVGDEWMQPWWAAQTEPMFLLNKSGPQVTNFISEVSRLKVYQDALVLAARGKRKATDDAKEKCEEVQRIDDKLARTAQADDLERVGEEMEAQLESIRECEAHILALEGLQRKTRSADAAVRAINPAVSLPIRSAGVQEAAEAFLALTGMLKGLTATANAILAIRGPATTAPLMMPDAELSRWKSLIRLGGLPSVQSFTSRAEKALKARQPVTHGMDDAVEKARSVATTASRMKALEASIAKLEAGLGQKVNGLDLSMDIGRVRDAQAIMESKVRLEAQIRDMGKELKAADLEADKLQREASKFTVCGECGRPLGVHHAES